jgi:hypothetical protein
VRQLCRRQDGFLDRLNIIVDLPILSSRIGRSYRSYRVYFLRGKLLPTHRKFSCMYQVQSRLLLVSHWVNRVLKLRGESDYTH